MMRLKPGTRVRCIRPEHHDANLKTGVDYTVDVHFEYPFYISLVEFPQFRFAATRFKPIVRVKAPCVPSLELQVKRAIAAVERMTPQQQAAHWVAQRESWVRGNAGID